MRDLTPEDLAALEFLTWLKQECGYLNPRPLPGGRYVAVMPLMVTHAIIVGRIGDDLSYEDRWCYHTKAAAIAAMDAWDGVGEPSGWHRHPVTGRRRDAGNPATEYVAP